MPDSRPARLPEPLARCPFCTTLYLEEQVRPVGRRRSGETSHATCLKCARAMMFAVDRAGGHVACVGLLTDCNADEAVRFEKGAKISLDEVLRAHVELRK
ncbi:MAG: hypothetical protein QG626_708 [Patescibacteria group bacterium]|nr:hypothetical protein [Patescibacteria group bacterium]